MSDVEMSRGFRTFLYLGGAEGTHTEKLIEIRDKCIALLKERHIPSANTVHYLLHRKNGSKATACENVYSKNIHDDNSTDNVAYVSCRNCKNTKLYRAANGEDVNVEKTVHFAVETKSTYLNYAKSVYRMACNSWQTNYTPGLNSSVSAVEVTCQNCQRTREYQSAIKRSQAAKKAAETRRKKASANA